MYNFDSFILTDTGKISDFIGTISKTMFDYVEKNKSSSFVLFYKYLTHSDLATFAKATQVGMLENNFLYYIKKTDMQAIETATKKPFQTAHQSCIGLSKEFYNLTKLPDPRTVDPYLINNYMDVFLVNDSLKYFRSFYTQEVFKKLGKVIPKAKEKSWDFPNLDVALTTGEFTPIDLHIAVHGIGMEIDTEFHKLRHHMFKGDTFILLAEVTSSQPKLFIVLEKNPTFYSIIGESNKTYENYQKQLRNQNIIKATNKNNVVDDVINDYLDDVVTRQQQANWRKMLANEMMSFSNEDGQVFCPFTYIAANFEQLGALFRASHIKAFSDPNTTDEEKYDINNGLLLCANADALFDKHLITINENKELVFSFLLDGKFELKQKLLLLQPIFQPILNEKRMEYIKYHRDMFNALEIERKKN